MNDQMAKIEIAAAAIEKLNELHSRFAQRLASQTDVPRFLGSLKIDGAEIHARCLGIELRVIRRPIVRGGSFCAIEYSFYTRHKEADFAVFRMYLQRNSVLSRDAAAKTTFCDSDNQYAAESVLLAVALALMDSPLFAPEIDD